MIVAPRSERTGDFAGLALLAAAAACASATALVIQLWPQLHRSLIVCGVIAASAAALALGRAGLRRLPQDRSTLAIVIALAVFAQLPALPLPPRSSDDVWRYLWEGRALLAGENPWRVAPASPRFDDHPLTQEPAGEAIRARINHPTIATIYPPLGMAGFALAALLGGSLASWRAVVLAVWALAALVFGRSRLRRGQDLLPILVWWWHPLVPLEVLDGAHVDALGVALLLIALSAWARPGVSPGRTSLAALLASLAVKPVAIALLPRALQRTGGLLTSRAVWPALALVAVLSGIQALSLSTPIARPAGELRDRELSELEFLDPSGRFAFTLDDAQRTLLDAFPARTDEAPGRSAELLGRYRFGALGAAQAPLLALEFDGQEAAHFGRPGLLLIAREAGSFALECDDATGFVLRDRASGELIARGQVRAERELLEIDLLRPFAGQPAGRAAAIKDFERPLMGWNQFSDRWAGYAFLHPLLQLVLRVRILVQIAIGLILVWLIRRTFRYRLESAALILIGWIVLTLPVLHPWYLLWLFPPLLIQERAGQPWARRAFFALALGGFLHR